MALAAIWFVFRVLCSPKPEIFFVTDKIAFVAFADPMFWVVFLPAAKAAVAALFSIVSASLL